MTLYIDTKPTLEWNRSDTNTYWYIDTVFGNYSIDYFKHKFYLNFEILDEDGEVAYSVTFGELFNTLDEAKAAAQADYERRTAERFKPIVLPERMNARQGDGSVHYCTGWNDVLDAIDRAKEAP